MQIEDLLEYSKKHYEQSSKVHDCIRELCAQAADKSCFCNLNLHPHAGAYSFADEHVHLHMRQTLPNDIALAAFLPTIVVPSVRCLQDEGPIRPKRVVICSIGERAALFVPTLQNSGMSTSPDATSQVQNWGTEGHHDLPLSGSCFSTD